MLKVFKRKLCFDYFYVIIDFIKIVKKLSIQTQEPNQHELWERSRKHESLPVHRYLLYMFSQSIRSPVSSQGLEHEDAKHQPKEHVHEVAHKVAEKKLGHHNDTEYHELIASVGKQFKDVRLS